MRCVSRWVASAFCCLIFAGDETGPRQAAAVSADEGGHATLLDINTFEGHLDKQSKLGRLTLVMFHVNWCKVCQRTFPKFANASTLVREHGVGMDFAHVDCTDDKSLCQEYEVKGYPTIKLFFPNQDVKPRTFKGQRVEESFLSYAKRMTEPPVRTGLTNSEDVNAALKTETFAMFLAAGPESVDGKDVFPQPFTSVAESWMDRHLFVTAQAGRPLSDLLPDSIKVPPSATLAAYSAGRAQQWSGHDNASEPEPAVAFYEGSLDDHEALAQWVEAHRFPGIWRLTEVNFYEITHSNFSVALAALDLNKTSADQEASLRDAHKALGADAGGSAQFLFGVLDGVSWSEELNDFNIKQNELPRILVTENNFEVWLEDYDQLRLDTLKDDLRGLLAGAPINRQARTWWAKVLFYKRAAYRFGVSIHVYGSRGPTEAILAVVGVASGIALTLFILWAFGSCMRAMLADDEDEMARHGYPTRHPGATPGVRRPMTAKED